MKKVTRAIIAVSFMLCCSYAVAETVGIVDINKVHSEIHLKKIIKVRVAQAIQSQKQILIDMNAKINAEEYSMQKKTSLTADQKKMMTADIAAQRQKFFNLQHDLQIKASTLYLKTSEEIKAKVEKILGQAAAKHNINRVFTEVGLIYALKKIDLTDELITELKKIYPVSKGDSDD